MNYYKHHLGDYNSATMHLTWAEDMAYTRLIRLYYGTEKPIPLDLKKVFRLVRVSNKTEANAVESVLNEFFTPEDDGWHNSRCDMEISASHIKSEHNREAGRRGGRPQKTQPKPNPDVASTESNAKPKQNPNGLVLLTVPNPSHKPLTNNHKPVNPPLTPQGEFVELPEWLSKEDWDDFCEHRKKLRAPLNDRSKARVISKLDRLRKAGFNPSDLIDQSITQGWKGIFETAQTSARVDYSQTAISVMDSYNTILAERGWPTATQSPFSDTRESAISMFMTFSEKPDFARRYFNAVSETLQPMNGCGFDWLIRRETFLKVKEGVIGVAA